MASAPYYGDNYLAASTAKPSTLLDAGKWNGKVRALRDTKTFGSTDTGDTGSLIYIGKLPKGAVPILASVKVNNAQTWGGTIGWAGATTALGSFAATNAATDYILLPLTANANTALTQDTDIYITTITQAIASGDAIDTTILYAAE